MATMDNDAKACYDSIIMSLATIVSGHYGLPRNTVNYKQKQFEQYNSTLNQRLECQKHTTKTHPKQHYMDLDKEVDQHQHYGCSSAQSS